jgi:hypothetical protein
MFDDPDSIKSPRPPAKGFKLFGMNEPWHTNACLNYTYNMGDAYTEGYRRAADKLVDQVEATGREQDFLVYPIMFLYRQHLELLLKEILTLLYTLRERDKSYPHHHRLLNLWQECQPTLLKITEGEGKEWFDAVTECIKQFDSVDPNSDGFRYPHQKDGTASVATIKHINLTNLKLIMADIADWLAGVTMHLEYCLENQPREEWIY